MAPKRTSARTRQTKLSFSPAAKSPPAKPSPPKAMRPKRSRQSRIDVNNIATKGAPKRTRTPDSSEGSSMRVGVPVRAKSNGVFGSSDGEGAEGESSSEAQSEAEKPAQARATRGSRKRQRAESSDEEGTVTVTVVQKRRRQAESEDEDELRVPSKRRRGERWEATPLESEEEVATPPRSTRRRLARRPATPEEEEEDQESSGDEGQGDGSGNEQEGSDNEQQGSDNEQEGSDNEQEGSDNEQQGSDNEQQGSDNEQQGSDNEQQGSGGEQEELQEELAFLRSSPLPDRGRLRSTQGKPKNKRQEALEALKRRRAGSTQEPSSTPARKTRTVVESDSDSELEVIKEEPDSDEVGDPESEVDDEEEDDRDANALDMFQEDDDDTGFIDDDPDAIIGEPNDDQPQLPMQFSSMSRAKPKELFKYAVEWMVMKKIHPAFNANDEIYELTFRKLGDEVKGLASSKFTSSAWTSDFTKAINARPELVINEIGGARREFLTDHCEACNRKNHPATFELSLTGQPYNPDTLEPLESSTSTSDSDSDSSSTTSSLSASSALLNGEAPTYDARGDRIPPESKTFTLGRTCKANAQVAHTLHHWRFHLNDWVRGYLDSNGYLTPAKLVKRDRKSDAKREAEARRIVDKMERKGEIAKLHRLYKEQVKFAVEAVNDYGSGWGRR